MSKGSRFAASCIHHVLFGFESPKTVFQLYSVRNFDVTSEKLHQETKKERIRKRKQAEKDRKAETSKTSLNGKKLARRLSMGRN